MHRTSQILIVGLVAASLFSLGVSTAIAAKPQLVIERSNGFPSGAHFNLNIHGKKDGFTCDPTPGGGSVFVSEYGESTIEYVTNRKASLAELTVLDPCAEPFDGDPAKVQLPREEQGYYVFGRILGKPNNGNTDGDPSSILLVPNPVLEVCNDDPENPDPDFPNYTDCDDALWALGLVTTKGVYEATEAEFVRFDEPTETKGKGKSKGVDITGLFMWTGYVCDAILDTNGPEGVPDGVIDLYDVPDEYDLVENDGNGDGFIDDTELGNWLMDQELAGNCTYYENQWVLNVADLVVQGQDITNDGTKLMQIRFYPVATTEFIR